MEDLAVITALYHSGSFGKNFVNLKKNVIHQPESVRIGKKCARILNNCPRHLASSSTQDLERSFSQYEPT